MATTSLTYNNQTINERGEMLSLTDMWRAAGGDDSKRPSKWLEIEGTEVFVSHISGLLNVPHADIIQGERGRNGGTWAHWQIGMAYAKYLSPEFHAWCNQVVRDYMETRGAPVQTLPDVVASQNPLYSTHQTLDKLADLIYNGMAHQSAEIAEVKSDVSALKSGQVRIEARLDEIARRGRRRIKDSVRGQLVKHTDQLGGRCPCCGVATVTQAGHKLPHAEFDHFYANSAPDADHVWLICIGCHAELTRNVSNRDERNAEFQAFQAKRRRLPGAQIPLLESA
jgi:hypothetical protein